MLNIVSSLLLVAAIAYLCGSIPSGYWIGKLLKGKDFDIRQYGSHKTGITNVLRTLGKVPAIIVTFIDVSKGTGPVLLARYLPLLNSNGWGPTVAGIMAILGQCCPLYIGFKGGRGAATAIGCTLVLSPFSFVIAAITASSAIRLSRYVSLGSIVGCITAMFCGIIFYMIGQVNPTFFARVNPMQLVFLLLGPSIVILFHWDCIARLLARTEPKMSLREIAAQSSQENV